MNNERRKEMESRTSRMNESVEGRVSVQRDGRKGEVEGTRMYESL